MADRVTVGCPGGHAITTAVRGRSTTCPQCHRGVYVRADGTTRHGRPAGPGDGSAEAPWKRGQAAPGPAARQVQRGESDPPFQWGRKRWDGPTEAAAEAEYDPRAKRTKLFDKAGDYIGWMDGDPYELAGK
jgi:hypothetical protein